MFHLSVFILHHSSLLDPDDAPPQPAPHGQRCASRLPAFRRWPRDGTAVCCRCRARRRFRGSRPRLAISSTSRSRAVRGSSRASRSVSSSISSAPAHLRRLRRHHVQAVGDSDDGRSKLPPARRARHDAPAHQRRPSHALQRVLIVGPHDRACGCAGRGAAEEIDFRNDDHIRAGRACSVQRLGRPDDGDVCRRRARAQLLLVHGRARNDEHANHDYPWCARPRP